MRSTEKNSSKFHYISRDEKDGEIFKQQKYKVFDDSGKEEFFETERTFKFENREDIQEDGTVRVNKYKQFIDGGESEFVEAVAIKQMQVTASSGGEDQGVYSDNNIETETFDESAYITTQSGKFDEYCMSNIYLTD